VKARLREEPEPADAGSHPGEPENASRRKVFFGRLSPAGGVFLC